MRFCDQWLGIEEQINTDIVQKLNAFNLREKVKEYQRNYWERILRMPIYRIPQ
jgi:hypothetical protein